QLAIQTVLLPQRFCGVLVGKSDDVCGHQRDNSKDGSIIHQWEILEGGVQICILLAVLQERARTDGQGYSVQTNEIEQGPVGTFWVYMRHLELLEDIVVVELGGGGGGHV